MIRQYRSKSDFYTEILSNKKNKIKNKLGATPSLKKILADHNSPSLGELCDCFFPFYTNKMKSVCQRIVFFKV